MSFSQNFIEEIKQRNPLDEVIGQMLQLKRAGSNYVGLCPFHGEKTPSFTVFPATASYYCFGCGAGGDVITFVMQTESLEYPEAVEKLALRAGVPMENDGFENKSEEPKIKKDRLFELNTDAARFFRTALFSNNGALARNYLDKRLFSELTVKRFGIGFAPDGYEAPLCAHLKSKGYTMTEISTAFLGGISKRGSVYDMFRNRIVFPIFDFNGRVAAFSARRLNESDERKYINTSDTPVFKKSRVLFGLNIAKNTKEPYLILCEGAPDAIAMHQAGFDNAIATLGTAITAEHARIIARCTKRVFLAYDIDKAGRTATLKGIDLLNQVGVDTKVISLGTETKDPDEFIKKYGAQAFRTKLEAAEGQVDYRIAEIISRFDMSLAEERIRAANELTDFLAGIGSAAETEIYVGRAAEKLGVSKESLMADVKKRSKIIKAKYRKTEGEKLLQKQSGYGDSINRDKLRFSSEASHEEAIIGMLLVNPMLGAIATALIKPEDFVTEFNKKVYALFFEEFSQGREPTVSKDGVLNARETGAVEGFRASRLTLGDNNEETLKAHIKSLTELKSKRDYDKLIEEDPANALRDYLNKLKNNDDKKS